MSIHRVSVQESNSSSSSVSPEINNDEVSSFPFLATLVALYFIPVSKSVGGRSFGLQPSSVAWSLRAYSVF